MKRSHNVMVKESGGEPYFLEVPVWTRVPCSTFFGVPMSAVFPLYFTAYMSGTISVQDINRGSMFP